MYNRDSFSHENAGPSLVRKSSGEIVMVNVQNAGEIYRCRICGNVVVVKESGGGELVCHGEPMQIIEGEVGTTP